MTEPDDTSSSRSKLRYLNLHLRPVFVINGKTGTYGTEWSERSSNAVPSRWVHGLDITFDLGDDINSDAFDEYVETEDGQDLIERMVDGHETVWDDHNLVGELDDDATEAAAEFQEMIDSGELSLTDPDGEPAGLCSMVRTVSKSAGEEIRKTSFGTHSLFTPSQPPPSRGRG